MPRHGHDRRRVRVDASGTALPPKFRGPRIVFGSGIPDIIPAGDTPLGRVCPGIYRLHMAMLLIALKDLRHAAYHSRFRPLAQFVHARSAQDWMCGRSLPPDHPLSFETVCMGLGLSPEAVRKRVADDGLFRQYGGDLAIMDRTGIIRVFRPGRRPGRRIVDPPSPYERHLHVVTVSVGKTESCDGKDPRHADTPSCRKTRPR